MWRRVGCGAIFWKEHANTGLIYFNWRAATTLVELLEVMKSLGRTTDFSGPFLHDMRNADFRMIEASDMERHIVRFKSEVQHKLENPCAFIVPDLVGFGKLRLWGVLAEVSEIRSEDLVLITTETEEAIDWMSSLIHPTDVDDLRAFIAHAELEASTVH